MGFDPENKAAWWASLVVPSTDGMQGNPRASFLLLGSFPVPATQIWSISIHPGYFKMTGGGTRQRPRAGAGEDRGSSGAVWVN